MAKQILELKGLRKHYQLVDKIIPALHNVSLSVNAGEIVGIIGRSGAGKSTLLRCINKLEQPDAGEVIVEGKALSTLSPEALRRMRHKMGMIFQHFNLLSRRSVLENVTLPLEIIGKTKAEQKSKALECLKIVGLEGRANAYPSELSGGQKQRVAIARAMASDAKVLLCDEATSALDPESTADILHLLKNLNEKLGLTIVLITHEIQVIRDICDQVYVMDAGEVIEKGAVENVFSNPQHAVTKAFVESIINKRIPEIIKKDLIGSPKEGPHNIVLRLTFTGGIEHKPIISQFVRDTGADINIAAGYIDQIGKSTYGTLVITISNEADLVKKAVSYLSSEGVQVQTLGYLKSHV